MLLKEQKKTNVEEPRLLRDFFMEIIALVAKLASGEVISCRLSIRDGQKPSPSALVKGAWFSFGASISVLATMTSTSSTASCTPSPP